MYIRHFLYKAHALLPNVYLHLPYDSDTSYHCIVLSEHRTEHVEINVVEIWLWSCNDDHLFKHDAVKLWNK